MELNEVRNFIGKQRWVFAKTYAAFAPHEYVIKNRCNASADEFDDFVDYIQENGMRMFYYKAERKYLFVDGYFYWVCGDGNTRNDPTAALNRCRPEDYDIAFVRKNTWMIKSEKEKRKAPEQEKLF